MIEIRRAVFHHEIIERVILGKNFPEQPAQRQDAGPEDARLSRVVPDHVVGEAVGQLAGGAGRAIAASLAWAGLKKIILALILSPILGTIMGFAFMVIFLSFLSDPTYVMQGVSAAGIRPAQFET